VKRILILLCINLLVFLVLFVIAEVAFRKLLFSDAGFMQVFRRAELYADYYSDDDFWKLQYRFGELPAPRNPDPLLGWVKQSIALKSHKHRMGNTMESRMPVLMYGDSFVEGFSPDILNGNALFQDRYYLVNYGVSGYGLDQIYLLVRETVDHYRHPRVIIGVLDVDLDRSVLTVRGGQKPYFLVKDGKLELHGSPVDCAPERFFSDNPPEIRCYLCRALFRKLPTMVRRGGARDDANSLYYRLTNEREKIAQKVSINSHILSALTKYLKERDIESVFLVFESPTKLWSSPDWRLTFLTEWFKKNRVKYILARDLIRGHSNQDTYIAQEYMKSPRDWHPNDRYYGIVAERLMEWLKRGKTKRLHGVASGE
jgi:hypothetical protein